MSHFFKKKIKNQGYTLIEVILVIAITGITFISIYGLYASTVKKDVDSRYEVIAANLAQEGVEIVRDLRDENQLATNDINLGLGGNCYPYLDIGTKNPECDSNRKLEIEFKDDNYQNCPPGGCSGKEMPFERECNVGGNNERMVVTCTVEWKSFIDPALTRKADATVTLTDWQGN